MELGSSSRELLHLEFVDIRNTYEYVLNCYRNHLQLAVNFQRPHAAPFVRKIISDSGDYIQNIVKVDPKYHEVVDECINNHPSCSEWAMGTGCDDNPKCKCTRQEVCFFCYAFYLFSSHYIFMYSFFQI